MGLGMGGVCCNGYVFEYIFLLLSVVGWVEDFGLGVSAWLGLAFCDFPVVVTP